jgi:folate-dependent phosphoribosylglycinamide formyltransferase PurN
MLTAGFDRAPAALALLGLLRRDGHTVVGVLVASPYRVARLRSELGRRGIGFVGRAALRLASRATSGGPGPLDLLVAEAGVRQRSLGRACRERDVPCRSVSDLNDEVALRAVRDLAPDWVLYAGGGILRRAFLAAAKGRILNAHSGPLPEVRGMNACEWSLLLGLPCATTIHVIDSGIDTGPIVERIPVPIEPGDTIETLRERAVVVGVHGLVRAVGAEGTPRARAPEADRHRQCYVLAPALRELAELALARRIASAAS